MQAWQQTISGQSARSMARLARNADWRTAPRYGGGSAVQLLPLGLSNANATNNQSVTVNGITAAGVAAGSSSQSAGNTYATYWNAGNTASTATIAGNQLSVSPVTSGTYSGYSFFKTDASGNSTGTGATSSVTVVSPGGYGGGSASAHRSSSPRPTRPCPRTARPVGCR